MSFFVANKPGGWNSWIRRYMEKNYAALIDMKFVPHFCRHISLVSDAVVI